MVDWTSIWRDSQETTITKPFMSLWTNFMMVERGGAFPFYIFPAVKEGDSMEDKVIKFLDYLVDTHELERNKADHGKTLVQRSNYVVRNFNRYSNDTMANLMFDTKLRKSDYDIMNSVISQRTQAYYAASTLTNVTILAYLSYFFRYRRLSRLQVLGVGSAYYLGFGNINNILYKLIVD